MDLSRLQRRRARIFARTAHRCFYCGDDLTIVPPSARTVDHLIPRVRGGTDEHRNLVASCALCNQAKADWTALEYREITGRPFAGAAYGLVLDDDGLLPAEAVGIRGDPAPPCSRVRGTARGGRCHPDVPWQPGEETRLVWSTWSGRSDSNG